MKIGDVYVSSWGYDQTNINFYRVIGVTPSGKTVTLIEVGAVRTPDAHLIPSTREISEPFRRRPTDSGGVAISSWRWAYPWDGKPEADTYTWGGAGH